RHVVDAKQRAATLEIEGAVFADQGVAGDDRAVSAVAEIARIEGPGRGARVDRDGGLGGRGEWKGGGDGGGEGAVEAHGSSFRVGTPRLTGASPQRVKIVA